MIPNRPSDTDDAATEPIADLPLFSREEVAQAAEDSGAERSSDRDSASEPRGRTAEPEQETLPIGPPEDRSAVETTPSRSSKGASLGLRLRAAALDAVGLLGVLVSLVAGGLLLGAPADLETLPYYLPTWLLFSFLYHVVPLLFWGRTPGMAYCGITSRGAAGEPLTIGQTIRRWLAAMATLALLGLPGLVALSGRSLADRLSRSSTVTV